MSMRNLLVLVGCLVVSTASNAGGGGGGIGGFAGSTEITQIANNTELVMSYVEQAQQTVHQFNQYQAMLQNLRRLNPSALVGTAAQKLWQDAGMNDSFRDLYRISVNGQRVAYSLQSLDRQMRSLNPGYGQYANFDYQNAYRNWSDTTRAASLSAIQLGTAHADDLQNEVELMGELREASSSADGQLKAIQAGNQVGIVMVSQLQKLRQLQMAQINAQQTAALADQGRREATDAQLSNVGKPVCKRIPSLADLQARGFSACQ